MAPTQLHSARVQIKRGSTVLRDSKLLLASGGQCALNGEWKESGASELRAKLEGVQIQPFLPEWWQSRIFGAVDGDLLIQQPAPGTLRWEGNVSMKNGKLEALPILSELDLFLGSPRFRSVPLRAASVKIVQAGGVTELREIKMDADGLLRVEGDVRIQDAQLEGLLQVGISPALVQWLPGVRSKIFSENRDGYVWAPMKLGGTVLQPVEDLSRRLAAAAAGSVLDTVRNVVTPPARPGETTQPANAGDTPKPNPLLAPVQTAVDTIKSLIPGK
jgi:hypothetical protein